MHLCFALVHYFPVMHSDSCYYRYDGWGKCFPTRHAPFSSYGYPGPSQGPGVALARAVCSASVWCLKGRDDGIFQRYSERGSSNFNYSLTTNKI